MSNKYKKYVIILLKILHRFSPQKKVYTTSNFIEAPYIINQRLFRLKNIY